PRPDARTQRDTARRSGAGPRRSAADRSAPRPGAGAASSRCDARRWPTARRSPAGRRRPPLSGAGGAFFKVCLLLGVGQSVLRTRRLAALLEPLQIVPAPLELHGTAEFLSHPVGYRPAAPMPAPVGGRPGERRPQLLLLLGRKHAWGAPGGRVLPIDH